MPIRKKKPTCCKDARKIVSRPNILARITSTKLSTPTNLLAQISAVGLVLASAGLGAIYAFNTGSQHGIGLAALMVIMAIALELAKPLSLAAAFTAFRSWSVARGLLLTVLALVAVGYSLTAELTLMAGARGDVVAQREAVLKAASSSEADATAQRTRRDVALTGLATLPAARPAAELQQQITELLLTPGANGCVAVDGRVTRTVCPLVADLKQEKALAERRASLEAVVAQPLPAATSTVAQVSAADPGATALHTYLLGLGFVVPAHVLTEWLALIPVLALEVGSLFAGVLVQGASAGVGKRREGAITAAPAKEPLNHAEPPAATADVASREKAKLALVNHIKEGGGSVAASERGLAALIGHSKPTVRRAINSLVLAGIVAAEVTRNGTALRLVA